MIVLTNFAKGREASKSGDFKTALAQWKPLAEQGDAKAQFSVGLMYDKGHGVLQNHETAAKWITLAAEQAYVNAQCNLGVMYHNGEGVLQDDKIAAQWFTLAAEQGHAQAQYDLGVMYAKRKPIWLFYMKTGMGSNRTRRLLLSGSSWLLSRVMRTLNPI